MKLPTLCRRLLRVFHLFAEPLCGSESAHGAVENIQDGLAILRTQVAPVAVLHLETLVLDFLDDVTEFGLHFGLVWMQINPLILIMNMFDASNSSQTSQGTLKLIIVIHLNQVKKEEGRALSMN